jgi:hypothetical protein
MPLKSDIVNFLKHDTTIPLLNFACMWFRVYPSAYQKDVADAIDSEAIKLGGAVKSGAGASYYMGFDTLDVRPGFSISNVSDQAYLVHECTHAYLDIQNTGLHSSHQDEATAYIAEAMFLEAQGKPPLGPQTIRTIAHGIAKGLLKGGYTVAPADVTALTTAIAAHPTYKAPTYDSNGFRRNLFKNWIR